MRDKIAYEGGEPIRAEYLEYHRSSIGTEEEKEIVDTLRSGWLTTGPKTDAFEKDFARYVGATHTIGVNSCTAALHLALSVLDIGDGDQVITTSFTFPSTVNVIWHRGATPVFADIDPGTLCISPEGIERAITRKTRAIIPVHFAGHPCEMDAIMDVARKRGIHVVEDAAHAIEGEYRGRKIGSIGDATAFSLYATKNITTGEGGMLATDDGTIAEKARLFSLHGITRNAWKRHGREAFRQWEVLVPGYKYNMSDLQASLGIQQLRRIEDFWKRRKKLVAQYREQLKEVKGIRFLEESDDVRHAYHLFVCLLLTEHLTIDRDHFIDALQAENIGATYHFPAIHLQPFYKRALPQNPGTLPETEYAAERVISLPLYPSLTEGDVTDVTGAVKRVYRYYKKSHIL
jgi:dTDP-4-amino-4,6-dideoxygalactose transaminase